MRILEIVPYFYPSFAYGGPVQVCYELSKRLVKRGHEVTVFATDVYDKNSRLEEKFNYAVSRPNQIDGIQTYYFRVISNYLAWCHNFYVSPQMIKFCRKKIDTFDIVHFHTFRDLNNIFIYKFLKKRNIPYFLSAHGEVSCSGKKILIKYFLDKLWGDKFVRDAKKLIALTQEEKQEYIKMGGSEKQTSIVPNGISIPDTIDEKKEEFILEKYGIKPEERIILYVGRIHKVKGLDILIKAYNKISDMENTKLIIIGPDEGYLNTIKDLIKKLNLKKKVKILGYKEGDEKYIFLKLADIFCLTSYKEGLPISVLEACANGTPVIISKECNVPEVERYNCGFITSSDPTEIAEKIDFLLGNELERKKMSNNCRRMVTETFSWDSVVEKLELLYENDRKRS